MSGIDFLLERAVAPEELRRALAGALGVGDVELVRDLGELGGGGPYAVVDEVRGDFRAHVSLDPGDRETVRAVAHALGTTALAPDESAHPYAWILVHPDGREEPVMTRALDDEDEYRIYRP